ncbi:MAG: EAL domain-containing protein [Acidimicrobiales bacterium]
MTPGGRKITLLGRVAISPVGGAPEGVGRRGRRAELVFAYLAAEHHRLVSNDELADALWPEGPPDTWEAALRGVLTEVRRFLAEHGLEPGELLTTARRGHQLTLPPEVTVDLDDARESLAQARTGLADGDAATAAEHAAHAWSLTRLPFLPAHDGDWVDGMRRELEAMTGRALELEARAHARAGDAAAGAAAAERLVQAEPFNEAAHQLRIRILGEAGDRSGAIKAFEHCRAVLAAELGVAPSEETEATLRLATSREATSSRTAEHPPSESHVGDLGGLSLLVVEDHDFQRRTAVMLLRNLGIGTVLEASDGLAAMELLRSAAAPDVILCDIDMPGMDGVEFIRHVAEGDLAGAVIIASALDTKVVQAVGSVSEGYGLQVLGAIEKPLTARRLGDLLATYRPRSRAAGPSAADGIAWATASEARAALAEGRITVLLQPVVDVATGQVAAAEVVPWWDEPDRGPVPRAVFLPLLEREGLLAELTDRTLALACEHIRVQPTSTPELTVSVDLAPASVHDAELPDRTASIAREGGIDPARVTLELDERGFRNAPGAALDVLTRLRVKGFGVSLDGFGSSRSRADQLRGVPLTEVKLAPSLVIGAAADAGRVEELEEAIEVGRQLEVAVVGDGCGTEDDLRLLLSLGCDRVQGAFIAEAMPGDELGAWVAAWQPDRLIVGDRG